MNSFWWRLTHLEPVLLRAVMVAVVGLLGAFGILIAPQIPDALLSAWVAIAALVQALSAWSARSAVTPNAKVAVMVPDPVDKPNVVAPGEAVTEARISDIVAAARASG